MFVRGTGKKHVRTQTDGSSGENIKSAQVILSAIIPTLEKEMHPEDMIKKTINMKKRKWTLQRQLY